MPVVSPIELTIPPKTTAQLTVGATTEGAALVGASITGTFRDPDLRLVASAIPFADQGDGTYTLVFDPSWTDLNGLPRTGTFYLDVHCVKDLSELLERWIIHVVL